jgi:MFS family permease
LTSFFRVYWMEYALSKKASPAFAWRFPLGFQIIFLLFLLAAAPFYPESPRYLAKIGDIDGALEVLTQCRGRGQEGAEKAKEELIDIQNAIKLEAKSATHTYYSMLFCKDDLNTRRRILLGGGVQVMQKFTGIDFIAAYAPEMFALAGFGGDQPALLAGGNLISYTASLAIAIYLCDRFGRRRLMWIGCVLMGAVLIAGGVLSNKVQHATSETEKKRLGVGVTTVLYIYTFTYGSTWLTTW